MNREETVSFAVYKRSRFTNHSSGTIDLKRRKFEFLPEYLVIFGAGGVF